MEMIVMNEDNIFKHEEYAKLPLPIVNKSKKLIVQIQH